MELIFWTIMIGFISGALTRYMFRKMLLGDLSMAMMTGLIGSVAGGYLGSLTGLYEYGNNKGLVGSVIGAFITVSIYFLNRKRKQPKN